MPISTCVSAVAQLAPDRKNFYITFTVDEGAKYKFGKITINSKIKELPAAAAAPAGRRSQTGDIYDAEQVQKAIDALTNAAGTKGYAFAEVHPRITRNRARPAPSIWSSRSSRARASISRRSTSSATPAPWTR